jgi:hypothetical protein
LGEGREGQQVGRSEEGEKVSALRVESRVERSRLKKKKVTVDESASRAWSRECVPGEFLEIGKVVYRRRGRMRKRKDKEAQAVALGEAQKRGDSRG